MIEILQNHAAGFSRLTERKFTNRSKIHGKKINNENLSLSFYRSMDVIRPCNASETTKEMVASKNCCHILKPGDVLWDSRVLEVTKYESITKEAFETQFRETVERMSELAGISNLQLQEQ